MPVMRTALLVPAIAAALVACQKEEPAPANNAAEPIVVRSDNQKKLFDLNDLDRAVGLKRAIQGQGLTCKQVASTGYVGRYKNMDVWTATCRDDRRWALFVSADDSVQVRNCKDLVQLGLPECKIQPGTEGGAGLDEKATDKAKS